MIKPRVHSQVKQGNPPMYFEFAGLPGAGKSTLSRRLKQQMSPLPLRFLSRDEAVTESLRRRNDGKVINLLKRLPPRLWRSFSEARSALSDFSVLSSRHLEFLSFFSKTLAESELPDSLIESIWHTTVRTFYEVQLISHHLKENELAIMDEAFFQRCFTLFGYMGKSAPENLIEQYARLAPISNHVIQVITDPHRCVDRFMRRYRSRPRLYSKLDKKELLNNFQYGNGILSNLCDLLKKQGATVWEVSGHGDIEEALVKLAPLGKAFVAN